MGPVASPVLLEGSYGEGGGALVRTALTMASLTQQPVRISSVRGGTKHPGLSAEDLILINVLKRITMAEVIGAQPNSHELSFLPTKRPRAYNGEIEWPDDLGPYDFACSQVILGALLPVLAQSGAYSSLTCFGESFGQGILTYDYFAHVTLGAHRKLGLYAHPELIQAGFGRNSKGEVHLEVEPSALSGINWSTRGELKDIRGLITYSGLSTNIAERAISHLVRLSHGANLKLNTELSQVSSEESGLFITLWAEFDRGFGGSTAMGQRGVRVEQVAQSAFDGLFAWIRSGATVDQWLADQILLTAALAQGDSTFTVPKLTQRLLTIAWVIKQFLPIRLTITGSEGQAGTITIKKS